MIRFNKSTTMSLFIASLAAAIVLSSAARQPAYARIPFSPGERLEFSLRWENIPAGEAFMEVMPFQTIDGVETYHFVMTARSNSFVDTFYKVRDRIDAFADMSKTRSMLYRKHQNEGDRRNSEIVLFNWQQSLAHYGKEGGKLKQHELMPGSLDPLSAFYYARMAILSGAEEVQRPVILGSKYRIGRARVVAREIITLSSGKTYDAFRIEPEMSPAAGQPEKSNRRKMQIWITADEKALPVLIKSKLSVGSLIGELVSALGHGG